MADDSSGVDAMSYRELQAMAKDFGRTDSGNHQLVPAKGKVDVLRANLAQALAERSANTANAQPAAPQGASMSLPPTSCVFTALWKTSQKTRNERIEEDAALTSMAEPTPTSGTATIVHTPDGIHAAADSVPHHVHTTELPP